MHLETFPSEPTSTSIGVSFVYWPHKPLFTPHLHQRAFTAHDPAASSPLFLPWKIHSSYWPSWSHHSLTLVKLSNPATCTLLLLVMCQLWGQCALTAWILPDKNCHDVNNVRVKNCTNQRSLYYAKIMHEVLHSGPSMMAACWISSVFSCSDLFCL